MMDFSLVNQGEAEIKKIAEDADDLIARAQSGDETAFGMIFEQHSRFVFRFIYAMIGDIEMAEEIKQETFLAAYRNIRGFDRQSGLRTWLCAIAKNKIYKLFRSRQKEKLNAGEEAASLNLADGRIISPDREFLNKELSDKIGAALARLDADKRLAFTLKELQQLSYNEISEITGSAIPKLKTDLRRAKIEMRRILKPYLEAKL